MELEEFMPGGKQRVKFLTIYAKNETEDIPTRILREIKKVLEKGNDILDRRYLKGFMSPKMVRVKD